MEVLTRGGLRLVVSSLRMAGEGVLAVRPERCRLTRTQPPAPNAIPAKVREIVYLGATIRYQLLLEGGEPLPPTPHDDSTAASTRAIES